MRAEGVLRSLFLYPYATSFIVTGLLWRWFFDPAYGLDAVLTGSACRRPSINWLGDADVVLYTLVVAGVWHAAGLVMVIMLAGPARHRRGHLEGDPRRRHPEMAHLCLGRPAHASAALGHLPRASVISVVKVYDLVVAMTNGGPGFASDMPAKFVMDNLFERQNAGQASAAVVVMLLTVVIVFAPVIFARSMRLRQRRPAR